MRDHTYQSLIPATRRHVFLLVLIFVFGAAVLGTAIFAAIQLNNEFGSWEPVFQEFVKVGFQAVAIGVLGGLAKLAIDITREREARQNELREREIRDREAKQNELRERRHQYIAGVVAASHKVDNARVVLSANRSVSTWTTVVTDNLVPARTQLREISHDLENWTKAGLPVFDTSEEVIVRNLRSMSSYLDALAKEYAEHKLPLAELQRLAENAEGQARTELLTRVWKGINAPTTRFNDFIEDGKRYAQYRDEYLTVLKVMRSSLLSNSAEKAVGKEHGSASHRHG